MAQVELLQIFDVMDKQRLADKFRSLHVRVRKPKNELQDYEIKETIGAGGYAKVKRAIHKPTGEEVAVKILKIESCEAEQIAAVQEEIKLHQKLLHENIAQIYEVIRKDNKIYIFVEFCQNGELYEKIVNNGPMSESQAAKIFYQILSALLYLKKMGMSHRDIKPENILFDKDWNAKLVDFGFSCKTLGLEGKFRKTLCGTPSYTPPQVLMKTGYNPELMDVWSLGVTLYAMLTGQLPFEGDNTEKRRAKIVNYKWIPRSFFSQKLIKLFSSIFVEAHKRVCLEQLLNCDFLKMHSFQSGNYVNFQQEALVPQDSIVDLAESQCKVDRKKVVESVKNYKMDRYHTIYYLLLKRQSRKGTQTGRLSIFKKQKKNSMRLQPISSSVSSTNKRQKTTDVSYTPQKPQKMLQIPQIKNPGHKGRTKTMQLSSLRMKRESTQAQDSPRDMVDCLLSQRL